MRKKGFTLLEVVLAVTLFWLMIGVILQAYTSIQLGNVKVLDTQKTIEVSENLFERLNDMSMDYVIDTWKYTWLDYAQIQNNENTKIINTWTLWLKQINDNISISIFTWCMSWNCSLYIQSNSTTKGCDVYSKWCIPTSWDWPVNLWKYDEVNVDYLNFEIYPDQQYVNINIKTSIPWWETLQSWDWIRLTTTIGFKTYDKYEWELTAETLCEDVCSISQISNTGIKQSSISLTSMWNNQTYNACTIWQYKLKDNTNWTNIFSIFFNLIDYRNNEKYDSKTIYDIAANCKNNESTCNKNCNDNNPWTNPYNCWYIRKTIQTKDYKKFESGNSLTWCELYNSYVMSNTCEDMCKASIFSCLDTENDPLQKRTWIKVTTWKYAGLYLQNPKEYSVADDWAYSDWIWTWFNGRNCSTWTITKDTCNWWFHVFIFCINWDTIYKCNNNWVFYCSGTYYWNWYRQWATELTKTEYEKDCVAWAWTWITNSWSVKNSWTRYVYSDVLSHTGFDPCICKVDYQYSYDAWWIIEWWNCWWLNSDYTAKDENLIYWQWTWFDGQKRSNISWLSWRVWVAPILNWNNCDQNVNGVCQRWVTYNNKTYDVVWGSGMYQNNVSRYNRKDCSCTNNTWEDNFYACVDRVHPCERPAQLMTLHLNWAIQNSNESKTWYCENKVNSGVWDYNSGCLIPNGTWCIGDEITWWYTPVPISMTEADIRTKYCESIWSEREVVWTYEYNQDTPRYNWSYSKYCRRKTNECKTYSENIITPEWYCEKILPLWKFWTYSFQSDILGRYDRDKEWCRYCIFTWEIEPIEQNNANDRYCKNKLWYELWLTWNNNDKCGKCALTWTEISIDINNAKQRYCENKVSEWLWNWTLCRTTQVEEQDAQKKFCNNHSSYYWYNNKCYQTITYSYTNSNSNWQITCALKWYYWYNNKCYQTRTPNYSNEVTSNEAHQYYCSINPTTTILEWSICYNSFNFNNIKNLSWQYCTWWIWQFWSNTYNLCYNNWWTNCLWTSTTNIYQWTRTYEINTEKKEIRQQYCTDFRWLHRDDTYECRKENKNKCIDNNEYTTIPSVTEFIWVVRYTWMDTKMLTINNKQTLCNTRQAPRNNQSCTAMECRRGKDISKINNYNDRYWFRSSRMTWELNFSRSPTNNNCRYCNNYWYEYTWIVWCEWNENCSLTWLMKWRCEHQETVLDYQWVWDSSSGFCAKYTPYESSICSWTITPLMTWKELTWSDEYYDEIYCKEWTISGHSIRLSLTWKDERRDEWTWNFCLDKNEHTDLCVYASSIESNWTGISSSWGSSIYYTGYDTWIYIPDDTRFSQKYSVLNSEYELILTRKKYNINYKNSETPFQLWIDKDWLEWWQEKDVLKDYTYTCDLSIAQQSNNILNIIEWISKSRQIENFENNLDSVPRYLRWLF